MFTIICPPDDIHVVNRRDNKHRLANDTVLRCVAMRYLYNTILLIAKHMMEAYMYVIGSGIKAMIRLVSDIKHLINTEYDYYPTLST